MIEELLRKRHKRLFQASNYQQVEEETGHTLGFKITTEIDVLVLEHQDLARNRDIVDGLKQKVYLGQLEAVLIFVEQRTGTERAKKFMKKVLDLCKQFRKEACG